MDGYRDPTTSTYFNARDITLELASNVDNDEFDLNNSVEMLARLCGAPDGSTIKVCRRLDIGDVFQFRVTNPAVFKYPSEYMLFKEGGSLELMLWVDSIYVKDELQGLGVGTRSVIIGLMEAKTIGVQKVSLNAAGCAGDRRTFWGYHVWPSMGFDADLPGVLLRQLPPTLADATCLSDLMSSGEGQRWWYDRGIALDVEFDLSDQSISWKLLECYTAAKGIRI